MARGRLMEERFLADAMLGKLAKWLRVMGYDTHYQSLYREGQIESLVRDGRRLLSRHKKTTDLYPRATLILDDHVRDQLKALKQLGRIQISKETWFSRCLACNVALVDADFSEARENVPEYIFYQNITNIRFCSLCGRFFWPGSHRQRMMNLLGRWGFDPTQA
jgi:uncharacterized protein with PIN domain